MNFLSRKKHNRKMKKFVKVCLIVFATTVVSLTAFAGIYLGVNFLKYQNLPLNEESLTSPALSIDVFDSENKKIKQENQFNGDYCPIEQLNQYTKDAFISIEDKDFYKHNGVNYKRILKAGLNNLKAGRLKEGASTISQQLIKNTHLSNEKTFERKIKEVVLTKKLEKNFDKDKILESYLNIIYFGNNCYGIESASKYYFDKSAKDLTLNESATLAGLIKSSVKYSPIKNYDNAIKRRNLVLSEMEKDGKISVDEKIYTQNQPITLSIGQKEHNKMNSYSQASIDESSKILNLTPKQLALGQYKIHTYCNEEKQKCLTNALSQNKIDGIDCAAIAIDAQKSAVVAYNGQSNLKLLDIKRQPGSTIKPILVYAPALNEDIISPSTQVLDEELKIGNFKPQNVNKKFGGYMSVQDAVKNSVNIPAIKVLSYVGIDTGKQYAEKLGIEFDESDDSFALALGGMTHGTTLKDLTNSYSVFANKGNFCDCKFVQYITDKNNKLVYIHKPQQNMVFREDSAYLMTKMLQETAKSGTARKLSDLTNVEVASKTGTVGKKNGNTDAYNISYTPEEVVGVWFGSLDNTPKSIAGGNQPTQVAKMYISSQNYQKTEFDVPSSVTEVEIDTIEKQENHRLVLASPYAPSRYKETAIFSRFNTPSEVSQNFYEKPKIDAECLQDNNQIVVKLNAKKYVVYQILKDGQLWQKVSDKDENMTLRLSFGENETEIKIVANYVGEPKMCSEKNFMLKKSTKPKDKWYL